MLSVKENHTGIVRFRDTWQYPIAEKLWECQIIRNSDIFPTAAFND